MNHDESPTACYFMGIVNHGGVCWFQFSGTGMCNVFLARFNDDGRINSDIYVTCGLSKERGFFVVDGLACVSCKEKVDTVTFISIKLVIGTA